MTTSGGARAPRSRSGSAAADTALVGRRDGTGQKVKAKDRRRLLSHRPPSRSVIRHYSSRRCSPPAYALPRPFRRSGAGGGSIDGHRDPGPGSASRLRTKGRCLDRDGTTKKGTRLGFKRRSRLVAPRSRQILGLQRGESPDGCESSGMERQKVDPVALLAVRPSSPPCWRAISLEM